MTLPITFWYGIRPEFICRERLVEAKEAGFNLIECDFDTETNKRVLDWCAELGLKADVRDPRMNVALEGAEGWEKVMDEMMADYKGHPALNRIFLRDEPGADYFPTLGRVVARLHRNGIKEYINLLPICALGGIDQCREHVRGYISTVKPTMVSYDHYNLMKREVEQLTALPEARVSVENRIRNGWENVVYEAYDREGFYDNLEIVRQEAMDAHLPWMLIILLIEHWHYRWPTEAEVRWEAFTSLAYGACEMSYFTYWTPGVGHHEPWSYHHGIILSDGTRGEAYGMVTRLNAELQAVYGGLTLPYPKEAHTPTGDPVSEAVYHVGEETDTLVHPFAGHGPYTALETNGRLVAGFFGGHRMMLVNKDHDHPVEVTVKADAPLWLLNKTTSCWEPCDGQIRLAPGDGQLLAAQA